MAGRSSRFTVEAIFKAIDKFSRPTSKMNKTAKRFAASMTRSFKKAEKRVRRLGQTLKRAGQRILQFAAIAAGIALAGLIKGFKEFAEAGDEIAKTSRQIGLSVESLQELRFASERQGVSSEVLTKSLKMLNRNVGDVIAGQGTLTTFLNKTNPKLLNQLKLVENNEQAFDLLVREINKLPTQMEKAALAQAAFGRAGQDMLKLFEKGPEGIAELRKEAQKYGLISTEAANKAEKLIDSVTNLKMAASGVGNLLFANFLQPITKIVDKVTDWLVVNRKLIAQKIGKVFEFIGRVLKFLQPFFDRLVKIGQKLFKVFKNLFKGGKDGILVFKILAKIFDGFIGILEFVTDIIVKLDEILGGNLVQTVLIVIGVIKTLQIVMGVLSIIAGTNPLVLMFTAAAAAVILLLTNWDVVSGAIMTGVKAIGDFFALVWEGIKAAGIAAWEGIKFGFAVAFNAIKKAFFIFADIMITIWGTLAQVILSISAEVGKVLGADVSALEGVIEGINIAKDLIRAESSKSVIPGETGQTPPVTPIDRSQVTGPGKSEGTLLIKDETGRAEIIQKPKSPFTEILLENSGAF